MSYLTTVLADSPDHYWRMADPGGFLAHDIGSSPRTLLIGLGDAIPYAGPNSDGGAVAIPDAGGPRSKDTLTLPSPRTLECWYFPIIVPTLRYLLAFDGNTDQTWAISTDNSAHLAGFVNSVNFASATVVTAEQWHHCVLTYDGANARLYLDAVLVAGPTPISAPPANARNFWVGSSGAITFVGYGAYAEVATFPSALSASRVSAHFLAADNRSGTPVFKNGTLAGSGSQDNIDALSLILASVRKTY